MDDIVNGQLAYVVRCVAAGKPCYGPGAQAVLLEPGEQVERKRTRNAGLTPRELEIARMVAGGALRTEIAHGCSCRQGR